MLTSACLPNCVLVPIAVAWIVIRSCVWAAMPMPANNTKRQPITLLRRRLSMSRTCVLLLTVITSGLPAYPTEPTTLCCGEQEQRPYWGFCGSFTAAGTGNYDRALYSLSGPDWQRPVLALRG